MLRNFHFSLEGNALKTIELTYQLAHYLQEKNEDLSALENGMQSFGFSIRLACIHYHQELPIQSFSNYLLVQAISR